MGEKINCTACDGLGETDDRGFALRGQPFFCAIKCQWCGGSGEEPSSKATEPRPDALTEAELQTIRANLAVEAGLAGLYYGFAQETIRWLVDEVERLRERLAAMRGFSEHD